ncbi:DUF2970 domain-containing protein [Kangiella sp. TOML190]|uniref:DUF2970 domain-containing protein n=1 Tax=Kangiella sp. TOML190 TaxID=2931351 RepID=UPI002041892C|nr:DUF2970 domain-containing protein [Kangiella sp. TOML190]
MTNSNNHDTKNPNHNNTAQPSSLGFWSTIKSVLGAMIGVQSEAQREKDFEKADPVKLILGGIIFTVLFILTILYFVGNALESAGQ